jgi:hypothetical protein
VQPEAFLFQCAHHAFRSRIALGVVVAGERLVNSQGATGSHERYRGGMTAILTHQAPPSPSGTLRELAIDRHVQSHQPLLGRASQVNFIPHDLLGVPIDHHDDVNSAKALDQDLRHVDAPPLVGLRGPGLAPCRSSLGFQSDVGLNQQLMLPH